MDFVLKELEEIKKEGLYRSLRTVDGPQGPRVKIDGREFILLCSNDYLGLADHPKVKEAAAEAIKRYGFGAGASRLVSGSITPHMELEERLAAFKGTEAALLFNSGYSANTGIIPAIAGRGDLIYSDRLNHASIVDGSILSRAKIRRYRHADMEHLQCLLEKDLKSGKKQRQIIVTDSVFSMDGDIAPLKEIVALAKEYGAAVMVDEAHGAGVLGKNGRGLVGQLGIKTDDIEVQMGTLGKALGTFGAYAAGKRELIDFLINRARPFIYSTALPPSVAAASIAAIDIVEAEPERRELLMKNALFMNKELIRLGFDTGQSETQIIPVTVGDTKKTCSFMEALLEEGIFAQAIRPPTVPAGTARIRITVTATHQRKDLEQALEAFEKAGKRGGSI